MLGPRGKMQPLPGSSVACDLADSTPAPCSPANYLQLAQMHQSQCKPIRSESPEPYPVLGARSQPTRKVPGTRSLDLCPPSSYGLAQTLVSARSRIDTQYLYKAGNLFDVPQRQPHGFIITPQNVHEKSVLPGPSFYRAGFNFAQIQITQREDTQSFKQRSRFVLQ